MSDEAQALCDVMLHISQFGSTRSINASARHRDACMDPASRIRADSMVARPKLKHSVDRRLRTPKPPNVAQEPSSTISSSACSGVSRRCLMYSMMIGMMVDQHDQNQHDLNVVR